MGRRILVAHGSCRKGFPGERVVSRMVRRVLSLPLQVGSRATLSVARSCAREPRKFALATGFKPLAGEEAGTKNGPDHGNRLIGGVISSLLRGMHGISRTHPDPSLQPSRTHPTVHRPRSDSSH